MQAVAGFQTAEIRREFLDSSGGLRVGCGSCQRQFFPAALPISSPIAMNRHFSVHSAAWRFPRRS
ncbi:MAG: hypothetical protein ACKPHU_16465, partial [Planctomycetaceae bacterium]